MTAKQEARWNARAMLTIALASLAIAYLGLAAAVGWPPFGGDSSGETPDVRIDLESSSFNPAGRDDPSVEYVCLVNAGGEAVQLAGWELRDAEGVVNMLPQLTLAPQGRVRVHPGRGGESRADVYGTEGAPVWTNQGDTITLVDARVRVVAEATYGTQGERTGVACGPPGP